MPSYYDQSFAKTRAFQLAGKNVWFVEVEGGTKKVGRVVGYAWDMAQIVLECDFPLDYPVDPMMSHLLPVAQLRKGAKYQYACVNVFQVDAELKTKTAEFPHNCPQCGAPAFVMFRTVECSNFACRHHKA